MTPATAPRPISASERLYGLDALRGIAAMAVVVMHAHVLMPEFPDLFPRGYLAVDFFFMLSGYVMARTYEPRLAAGLPGLKFFAARYRRLWPTMALGGVLFIPFLAEGTRGQDIVLWHTALVNLLLLPSPWSGNYFALNVPAWSIFFELVANAAHGVLWRVRTPVLAMLSMVSFAWLVDAAWVHGHLDLGSRNGDLGEGLARVATTYTMGIVIWRWWGERRPSPMFSVFALIAMPLWFALPDRSDGLNWLVDVIFVGLLCAPILIGGIAQRGGRWISTALGELSFPLYAIHYPLLYWFRAAGAPPALAIVGCVLGAGLVVLGSAAWKHQRQRRRA
ncbi:acyltransferase [Novosphingobium sp. MW5]|nr:acyltransferase [Novosphingobium sp. MW5]